MKKSASGEQTVSMNRTDFERAAAGKKLKHTFKIHIRNNKLENAPKQSQLVKQFATILIEDDVCKQLLKQHDYQFIFNNNFQLTIKNCNPPVPKDEATAEDPASETVEPPVNAVEENNVE